jgi:hypothetical protein
MLSNHVTDHRVHTAEVVSVPHSDCMRKSPIYNMYSMFLLGRSVKVLFFVIAKLATVFVACVRFMRGALSKTEFEFIILQ